MIELVYESVFVCLSVCLVCVLVGRHLSVNLGDFDLSL